MSWLFKDSKVTAAWINFDHVQSNSRNDLRILNCPKWDFFLKKTTNKMFMYLLAPFIVQNQKKKKNLK